ncbi:hypothetical protein H5410_035290 [Solanum commersonii]|uniref:Uncharacterized protein n=1 Tax=Solanum commersonii TaxID=4109 RepID=A0A9J5Y293_SOLCO|nr:hypothetical protein H5410_035290 [Solanum commersonii]
MRCLLQSVPSNINSLGTNQQTLVEKDVTWRMNGMIEIVRVLCVNFRSASIALILRRRRPRWWLTSDGEDTEKRRRRLVLVVGLVRLEKRFELEVGVGLD